VDIAMSILPWATAILTFVALSEVLVQLLGPTLHYRAFWVARARVALDRERFLEFLEVVKMVAVVERREGQPRVGVFALVDSGCLVMAEVPLS